MTARRTLAFALLTVLAGSSSIFAQGMVLPGVGPVNRSIGGVAVAAPLDAAGALHWNPATIAALPRNEMMFGVEAFYTRTTLTSSVAGFTGSTDSNSGVKLLPSVAWVARPEGQSTYTFGLSALTIGGFGVDYAGDNSNPVLATPTAGGVGPVYSRLGLLQIAPTVAARLTDRVSFGFAPTFTMADLQLDPFFGAAPDDANGDGTFTYPSAVNARNFWGLGFQVGLYVETESCWNFGVSYKSKQWFEDFVFNSSDELGNPRRLTTKSQFPQIISGGISYTGIHRWLFAADVRHIDYEGTDIFGDPVGFDAAGRSTGLGWQSVIVTSLGVQHQLTEEVSLRAGYIYTEAVIPDATTSANLQSPALWQHGMSLGGTVRLTTNLDMSLAWVRGFPRGIDGPLLTPAGPVPGSNVRYDQVGDTLNMGFTAFY